LKPNELWADVYFGKWQFVSTLNDVFVDFSGNSGQRITAWWIKRTRTRLGKGDSRELVTIPWRIN